MPGQHTPYKSTSCKHLTIHCFENHESPPSAVILVSCCQPLSKIFSTATESQQAKSESKAAYISLTC